MLGIHSSLPKLGSIHFTQSFVALDLDGIVKTYLIKYLLLLLVIVGIIDFFVFLNLLERRHGKIYMTLLDELRHEPVDKGQHQSIDMGTVHVGIGHDYDLVITEL